MNKIDTYIKGFPVSIQDKLSQIRKIIKEIAPDATECLSYGMPAYKINGKPLVYFAAFKNHIGFYALPTAHEKFSAELSNYKHGKGSVQFPHNRPIPYDLIKKIH